MQGQHDDDNGKGSDHSSDTGGIDDQRRSGGNAERGLAVARVRLPSASASEAAALIGMIERAAADPAIDIERVERMYAMYERAAARNARSAYDDALALMQPELPVIDKRGKGNNGNKYALWEDIAESVLDVTGKHGFSLTFRVQQLDKAVHVTAVLSHRDGHREETSFPFPLDTSGNKNPIQAVGSSISYGKRYTACALLNIITRGEDDDGGRGAKQKSSAAAKRDGTDKVFNEIVHEFRTAINIDMLRHVAESRQEDIDALPFKWRDLARDEYATKMDELRARI